MTRDECIQAMAEAIDISQYQDRLVSYKNDAYVAYEALLPHIQAERERVREMCAEYCNRYNMALESKAGGKYLPLLQGEDRGFHSGHGYAAAIRALDIGGNDE